MTSDRKLTLHPDFLKPPPHLDQHIPDRVPTTQRSEPYHPPIDPRRWYLDENTGEYLRVKHRDSQRVLVDTTSYNERWTESVLAGQELLKLAGGTIGLLVAGTVLWAIAEHTRKPDCILPGSWAIICYLTSILLFFQLLVGLVREGFRDIGPEPVSQPPRREQAEQQRVHGTGRFMNRDEIHRAASGETAFPAGVQQYKD